MPTIASRELRNHTATVLAGVERGEVYTVTVRGRVVAEIRGAAHRRRPFVPVSEVLALWGRQQSDPTLAADLAWITEGTTDDVPLD